ASGLFDSISLTERQLLIAHQILKEIRQRLRFLLNVGLEYLTLDRSARTLSGGEAQRIRLATQIGTQLVGVLYILDEPSIGLHQRDNQRLIHSLEQLRDLGNTVIVVEHDREMMESADMLIDIGPRAGEHGGELVAYGPPRMFSNGTDRTNGSDKSHRNGDYFVNADSPTSRYLSGQDALAIPKERVQPKPNRAIV